MVKDYKKCYRKILLAKHISFDFNTGVDTRLNHKESGSPWALKIATFNNLSCNKAKINMKTET